MPRVRADPGGIDAAGQDDRPQALTDREILATAFRENRIILTNGRDFADLVFRDGEPHAGVILFRLGYVPINDRIRAMRRGWLTHLEKGREFGDTFRR